MNNIIIYTSPTCGKCKALKSVLKEKNISFVESEDMNFLMEHTNIRELPVMEMDGKYIKFAEALKWALAQEVKN